MLKNNLNLRKVVAIAICLTATTMFSSCDKETKNNPAEISVADNSCLTQEVFADNEHGSSGVNFTTTGAWTSSISTDNPSAKSAQLKAKSSSANWISISPDSGTKAGNYTIAITLETNTTGEDRTANITISCNGKDITIAVTQKGVKEDGTIPEVGLELETTNVSLTVGSSQILKANQDVTFTSSNPNIVEVRTHPDGYLHACELYAYREGTATITATSVKGGTATCTVVVNAAGAVSVTGVSLNKSATSLTVGNNETLIATIIPANATNKGVQWLSSATGVATVNPNGNGYGYVTAVAPGTATITATTADGNKTATCTVTVNAAGVVSVTGVSLKSTTSLAVGDNEMLTATFIPANATNRGVSFSSNATDVATVNPNGYVTAVASGTATITATTADGGKTATCTVTVYTVSVTGVSLNKSTTSLTVGNGETLIATIAPANATNKGVQWLSSATGVATVNANGNGYGYVTAVAPGTATITATTAGGSKTATCTVTVNP